MQTPHKRGLRRRFLAGMAAIAAIVGGVSAAAGSPHLDAFGVNRTGLEARPVVPHPPVITSSIPASAPAPTSTSADSNSAVVPGSQPGRAGPARVAPQASPRAPAAAGTLRRGDRGPRVRALQDRLHSLGYWVGTPSSTYDAGTAHAVIAFQKAEGLGRDGVGGPSVQAAINRAARPTGRDAAGDRIEIDLRRQLVLLVGDGRVRWALSTSTGAPGATATRPGRFTVQREIDGVRRAELGDLYRPKYFDDGIALHGSPSVPTHPASHGCARLSNDAMDLVWSNGFAPLGMSVWVY